MQDYQVDCMSQARKLREQAAKLMQEAEYLERQAQSSRSLIPNLTLRSQIQPSWLFPLYYAAPYPTDPLTYPPATIQTPPPASTPGLDESMFLAGLKRMESMRLEARMLLAPMKLQFIDDSADSEDDGGIIKPEKTLIYPEPVLGVIISRKVKIDEEEPTA